MTANQILTALGEVDESLLDVCEHSLPRRAASRKRIYAAACIALAAVAAAAAAVLHVTQPRPQPESASDTDTIYMHESAADAAQTSESVTGDTVVFPPSRNEYDAIPSLTQPDTEQTFVNETIREAVTSRYGSGDSAAPNGETHTADDSLWQNAPITTKYPTMQWNEQTYMSRGRARLDGHVSASSLGEATLSGFDGDPLHTIRASVLPIDGIADRAAVAVRFDGVDGEWAYVCQTYSPQTLGQLMDDLHLRDNCTFTAANGCGGDLAVTVFSAPDDAEVWKLFDRAAALDTREVRHEGTLLLKYSFPLIGYDPGSMMLTNDGFLLVEICEREYVFAIGQDRVQAFFDYLNRACSPRRLDATTQGFTQTP